MGVSWGVLKFEAKPEERMNDALSVWKERGGTDDACRHGRFKSNSQPSWEECESSSFVRCMWGTEVDAPPLSEQQEEALFVFFPKLGRPRVALCSLWLRHRRIWEGRDCAEPSLGTLL